MDRKFGVEIEAVGVEASRVAQALRSAGIEAQVQSYNHTTQACWKLVHDGSLYDERTSYTFELVSPPLAGEAGFEQLRTVSRVLAELGVRVNRSCGFHVHVEVADLDDEALKRVVALAVRFERSMDKLVSKSRRGSRNQFCKSDRRTLARTRPQALQVLERCSTFAEMRSALRCDRYHKLNLESYSRYRTVEFRQHNGTTDSDKMIPWIALCIGIVESAKRSRSVCWKSCRTSSFAMMLKRVPAQFHAALIARREQVARGQD